MTTEQATQLVSKRVSLEELSIDMAAFALQVFDKVSHPREVMLMASLSEAIQSRQRAIQQNDAFGAAMKSLLCSQLADMLMIHCEIETTSFEELAEADRQV